MYTPGNERSCAQNGAYHRASSGIGEALARTFARNGFDLVITARRIDRLEALASSLEAAHEVHVTTIQADLADPAAPLAIMAEIEKRGLQIDALVNNAGFMVTGLFEEAPWEKHRDQLQVMLVALCELTYGVLPGMVERGRGYILNVSSAAGVIPGSGRPIYGGIKAMIVQFSRCLRLDLKGTGVSVTVTLPGYTDTDLLGNDGFYSRIPKRYLLTPEQVAEESYKALMRKREICIPGRAYRQMLFAVRWLPDRVSLAFVGFSGRREQARIYAARD